MLKHAAKAAVVLATSAVALPYAVAFLTHMMWGWPRNYRRALSPRKVYALNYTLLMEVKKIKYAVLKLRWMYFYRSASPNRLIKDLKYGSHGNSLDLYVPVDHNGTPLPSPRPVVMFLYGGTWSSGDKSMYGLLCSQLADNTGALVCCPNYTLYPKGLVDDMVQDVVDCLDWLQQNVHTFGGDKDRVALVGHSAGGHLAMLAVLELVQKCLIHNPQSAIMSTEEAALVSSQYIPHQSSEFSHSFVFEEGYFDGSEGEDGQDTKKLSSAGSESFFVVDRSRQRKGSGNSVDEKPPSDSFFVVGEDNNSSASEREGGSIGSIEEVEIPKGEEGGEESLQDPAGEGEEKDDQGREDEKDGEAKDQDIEDEDSVLDESQAMTEAKQEGQGDIADSTQSHARQYQQEKDMATEETQQQQEGGELHLDLREDESAEPHPYEGQQPPHIYVDSGTPVAQMPGSLASVKVVIGLAGVYDITDHYAHEAWRGIEDVSNMARAMFGPQHFDRFSPSFIAQHLPKNTRLPAVQLIHGDKDIVVPDASSMKLGKALWDMGCRNVQYSVIPQCDHYEICLDLMDPDRAWHSVVLGEILRATNFHLRPL